MSLYWLVRNAFLVYEELNSHEKLCSNGKVQVRFGHQQFKVLLSMKCGASEAHTAVLGHCGFWFPNTFIFYIVFLNLRKKSSCHSSHLCLHFRPLKACFP